MCAVNRAHGTGHFKSIWVVSTMTQARSSNANKRHNSSMKSFAYWLVVLSFIVNASHSYDSNCHERIPTNELIDVRIQISD